MQYISDYSTWGIGGGILNVDNADLILPNLWLGGMESDSEHFIKKNKINVIFNCTTDYPFANSVDNIYMYRLAVDDDLQLSSMHKMFSYLLQYLPILHQHLSNGDRVLVHCHAGMQRSAIVVAAYLIVYCRMTVKQAVIYMKQRRPIVFSPHMNFYLSLQKLIEYIKLSNIRYRKNAFGDTNNTHHLATARKQH